MFFELPQGTTLVSNWHIDFKITPTYRVISDTIVDINARRSKAEIGKGFGVSFTSGTITQAELIAQYSAQIYKNQRISHKTTYGLVISGYSAYGISAASAAMKGSMPFGSKDDDNIGVWTTTGSNPGLKAVGVDMMALMLYPVEANDNENYWIKSAVFCFDPSTNTSVSSGFDDAIRLLKSYDEDLALEMPFFNNTPGGLAVKSTDLRNFSQGQNIYG